jgi:DNA ligase-1
MILYKKDIKGKIRFLKIYVEGCELIQESGILGTDKPIQHKKICKSKNIGKSNESTAKTQAEKELSSLIKQKLKEGYFQSEKEAEKSTLIFPMLAKNYNDYKEKIDWNNAFGQPKLDGMRSLITVNKNTVTIMSRDGRYINTLNHIEESFKNVKSGIYDGELYAHGLSFQKNMSLIKKWYDGEDGSIQIKFHCYDFIAENTFKERLKFRDKYLKNINYIELVETVSLKSENDLIDIHKKYISEGYEGTIVRHGNEYYEANKRSSSLLKYKDFIDIACPIVDIIPANQRPEWGVPVLMLPDGKTFEAGMKYSHKERVNFLNNRLNYIGKIAEIRFFEYYDTGIPRFPIMYGIRIDK